MAVYGWEDIGLLNSNLFCEISASTDNKELSLGKLEDVVVRGKIVSYSISSAETYESPLEGSSVDDKLPTLSAMLQSGVYTKTLEGKTFKSLESSFQVWRGTEPLQLSITLEFIAKKDVNKEVELPIAYLHMMKSPNLKTSAVIQAIDMTWDKFKKIATGNSSVFGRIPFDINIDFMNKRFNSLYKLESINEDVDAMRINKDGRVRQQVSLSFRSKRAIIDNGNDIILR